MGNKREPGKRPYPGTGGTTPLPASGTPEARVFGVVAGIFKIPLTEVTTTTIVLPRAGVDPATIWALMEALEAEFSAEFSPSGKLTELMSTPNITVGSIITLVRRVGNL